MSAPYTYHPMQSMMKIIHKRAHLIIILLSGFALESVKLNNNKKYKITDYRDDNAVLTIMEMRMTCTTLINQKEILIVIKRIGGLHCEEGKPAHNEGDDYDCHCSRRL